MPISASTVRGLQRELVLHASDGEHAAERAMRRADRRETDEVCRHLLGRRHDLVPAAREAS
ncbi:hypothetical protein [Jatrophihabitans fulvus]